MIGDLRKCLLYVLSFISLGTASALLLSVTSVHAASSFDGAYVNTSNISVGADGAYGLTIPHQDITTTWAQYITDKTKWASSTYNGDADTSFQAALDHGRWAVSEQVFKASGGTVTTVIVYWTEDTSLALSWNDDGFGVTDVSVTGSNIHSISIGSWGYVFGGGSATPVAWAYSTNQGGNVSTSINCDSLCVKNLFVYTDHPNYPSGYAGDSIPGNPVFWDDIIKYKVVDKTAELWLENVDKTRVKSCTLYVDDDPAHDNDENGGGASEVIYDIPDCTSHINHQFPAYGYYYVRAELTKNDDTIRTYVATLHVDGSTFSGSIDTTGDNPDNPDEPSYDDCSTYGTDLIGGFGCVISNFGKWITKTVTDFVVPSKNGLQALFINFDDQMRSKFGFLYYPVDFIKNLFNTMSSVSNNCNAQSANGISGANYAGTFFGAPVSLNFCSTETQFPAIYNFVAGLTRILVAAGLLFAIYRKLREKLSGQEAIGAES